MSYILEIINFLIRYRSFTQEGKNLKSLQDGEHPQNENDLSVLQFGQEKFVEACAWFFKLIERVCSNMMEEGIDVEKFASTEKTESIRLLISAEYEKIGAEGRDLLFYLEGQNILTKFTMEIVLTQIMDLPDKKCIVEDIKYIVWLVLLTKSYKGDKFNKERLDKFILMFMDVAFEC